MTISADNEKLAGQVRDDIFYPLQLCWLSISYSYSYSYSII